MLRLPGAGGAKEPGKELSGGAPAFPFLHRKRGAVPFWIAFRLSRRPSGALARVRWVNPGAYRHVIQGMRPFFPVLRLVTGCGGTRARTAAPAMTIEVTAV